MLTGKYDNLTVRSATAGRCRLGATARPVGGRIRSESPRRTASTAVRLCSARVMPSSRAARAPISTGSSRCSLGSISGASSARFVEADSGRRADASFMRAPPGLPRRAGCAGELGGASAQIRCDRCQRGLPRERMLGRLFCRRHNAAATYGSFSQYVAAGRYRYSGHAGQRSALEYVPRWLDTRCMPRRRAHDAQVARPGAVPIRLMARFRLHRWLADDMV